MRQTRSTRVVLIGTGLVGASFAYAATIDGTVDELVLIDVNERKAEGDVMDLNHGMPFASAPTRIWRGTYDDCRGADVVVLAAGVAQKPGQTRLDLLEKNTEIFNQVVCNVMGAGFDGVLVVATNPVDILSHVTWRVSGLPAERVIGTGTLLDTARFRYLLGDYFQVDPRNVHAYIIGEHGASELPVWSHAYLGGRTIRHIVEENPGYAQADLDDIFVQVRDAAYEIIDRKGATYYGIGLSLVRLVTAIVRNENAVLTVSTLLKGEYGLDDIYIGVPAIVNSKGIREVTVLDLTDDEMTALHRSADVLKDAASPALL